MAGNASIRRGYALYLGVNTTNYNSWQARFRNSGSTAIIDSQTLQHTNSGYGSSTFFTSNATGFNIGTGSLLINSTAVIDAARNFTPYQIRAENGDDTPAGTQFSNVIKGQGTSRTVYFDGDSDHVSTWYGVGNNAYAAIDCRDGVLDIWINDNQNTWRNVADFATGGLNISYGNLKIASGTVINANKDLFARQATFAHTDHNYVKIENTSVAKEQMVRFRNSQTNYWYAGIRTSAGIASTADFHIYSTALADDAFALTTSGDLVAKRNLNTKTGAVQINGNAVIDASRDAFFRKIETDSSISANNESVMRAAHYAQAGSDTGAILIQLPGNRNANYSMAVIRVTTYEYSSDAHNVYHISGHDWTSGWYNVGVTHQGCNAEEVRLLDNSSTNKQAIQIGTTGTGRAYLHVTVDIIASPSFYNNSMDWQGTWNVDVVTSLSGWTSPSNIVRKQLTSSAGNSVYDAGTSGRLYFGGNSYLAHHAPNEIKFKNGFGEIKFGPQNGSGAHVYTDLARFYFNKQISLIDNTIVSYNGDFALKRQSSDTYKITITTSGLVSTQNVTAYSDERLKKDIKPIGGALETVKKLQGVTYTRRDSGNRDIGFIAQSIERDCPEIADRIVNTSDDEMGTKHLNYQNMVALLTEAIKDQQQQIDSLKDIIKEMTNGDNTSKNSTEN